MTKVPTKYLTGAALDWAVATCEGEKYQAEVQYNGIGMEYPAHRFSTDWSQAGPLIEREAISIIRADDDWGVDAEGFCNDVRIAVWCAERGQQSYSESTNHEHHEAMYQFYVQSMMYGPTPLIAAMRCYVASKLGNYVEVPNELVSDADVG